jgi:hypothetical protein
MLPVPFLESVVITRQSAFDSLRQINAFLAGTRPLDALTSPQALLEELD